MKVAGIIAEYNPFHNGHKYHLEQARAVTGADAVVSVISGSVTQRGEAVLWDKWSRAQMAIENGVDLVLELPFMFSCNSAEEFARGGVSILSSLGCITDLVFGCESDPDSVISMAKTSAENETIFTEKIREGLEKGLSYPAARSQAMIQFADPASTTSLDRPNDILAVEYVRQLVLQKSTMSPQGVLRRGEYHNADICEGKEATGEVRFSSATAIRQALKETRWADVERAVPTETMSVLRGYQLYDPRIHGQSAGPTAMDTMILSNILRLGPEGLRCIYGCAEGLEYRIWNALPKVITVEELLKEVSSGRYPTARLRRLLMDALIGLTKEDFAEVKASADRGGLYVRVLGCNEKGAKLLKQIKKDREDVRILTNLNRELTDEEKCFVKGELLPVDDNRYSAAMKSLKLDIRAADVLQMGRGKRLYDGSDFVKIPYIAHKKEKNHK